MWGGDIRLRTMQTELNGSISSGAIVLLRIYKNLPLVEPTVWIDPPFCTNHIALEMYDGIPTWTDPTLSDKTNLVFSQPISGRDSWAENSLVEYVNLYLNRGDTMTFVLEWLVSNPTDTDDVALVTTWTDQ